MIVNGNVEIIASTLPNIGNIFNIHFTKVATIYSKYFLMPSKLKISVYLKGRENAKFRNDLSIYREHGVLHLPPRGQMPDRLSIFEKIVRHN